MPQYLVPKFIEKKPKIVGPMTFRQFIYIGIAGLISAILYFTLPLIQFTILAILAFGVAIALAFITVGGKPLPALIGHSLNFLFSSKAYLWKKKRGTPRVIQKTKEEPKKKEEKSQQPRLRVTQKSRLKQMENKVKTYKQ